ncbi:MAG: thiamine pyrophosphate-dependent enzyme, partial [Actinomycetota bacterium]|nr:thiamine pyrophosphate-dependent enzyme [Actinomycetota bacterium]
LIVAGRQMEPRLAAAVTELAAATGYPILAEPTSQLRLGSHDRARVITAYDAIARAHAASLDPDLVIRFGDMPTSKALREWIGALDGAAQLVVDQDAAWNDPTRKAGLVVRAEPVALAAALAEAVPVLHVNQGRASSESQWLALWQLADEAAGSAIRAGIRADGAVSEPAVWAFLADVFADGENVYTASSMPIRDQEAFLGTGPAQVRFLANRGANGIDGLISSAAGAAAATRRPTWAILGDLGLHHDSNGLAALRSVEAPVRIVCLNNDGGGIFEFLPQAGQVSRDEFEAAFGTPIGVNPERLAADYGIPHVRIESPGELGDLPDEHVLAEVVVDRRTNVELHERLWGLTEEAIATALATVSPG